MFAKECSRTHCQSRLEEGIERLSSKLFYPYNRKSFPRPQEITYSEISAGITKNCSKLTLKTDDNLPIVSYDFANCSIIKKIYTLSI